MFPGKEKEIFPLKSMKFKGHFSEWYLKNSVEVMVLLVLNIFNKIQLFLLLNNVFGLDYFNCYVHEPRCI